MGTELSYVLKDVYLKATNPQILKMEKLDNFIKKRHLTSESCFFLLLLLSITFPNLGVHLFKMIRPPLI